MAFILEVLFSGPCLYVRHPSDKTQVAVLMPDARLPSRPDSHPDEEPAEPHVGFIRVNLGDVRVDGLSIPLGSPGDRKYEIVHRFDRESLVFEELAPEPVTVTLDKVPDFDVFLRDELDLAVDLFGADRQGRLVMRTILKGGTLNGPKGKREWRIPQLKGGDSEEYKKDFAPVVHWNRDVPGNCLTLRIVAFDGSSETRIPLGPFEDGETVTVEVANLCAYNPLEWTELPMRSVVGTDEDFKWVYQLLQPRTGSYAKLLKGAPLPAPRLVRGGLRTGDEDCIGAQITRGWSTGTADADTSPEGGTS